VRNRALVGWLSRGRPTKGVGEGLVHDIHAASLVRIISPIPVAAIDKLRNQGPSCEVEVRFPNIGRVLDDD